MAEESASRVLNYDVLVEGEDVGDVALKLTQNGEGYLIVEHSRIQVSSWMWTLDITTVQSETFQQGVGLIKSDSKTWFEGISYWSKINAGGDKLFVEFTEITSMTDQEEKQLSHLSFAISGKVSANTEEAISLSEALFSGRNETARKGGGTERLRHHL
ncbi:MAG: hypothetical protein L3J89_12290 [Gammaproteobacteria bacterium]|nr:hypothetical protein [Gammaproteobacteria bacterium]